MTFGSGKVCVRAGTLDCGRGLSWTPKTAGCWWRHSDQVRIFLASQQSHVPLISAGVPRCGCGGIIEFAQASSLSSWPRDIFFFLVLTDVKSNQGYSRVPFSGRVAICHSLELHGSDWKAKKPCGLSEFSRWNDHKLENPLISEQDPGEIARYIWNIQTVDICWSYPLFASILSHIPKISSKIRKNKIK